MAQATITTTFQQRTPAQEFDGALVRAYSRRLATVVTVGGAVTAVNVDRVVGRVCRHVLDDSVVIDLACVDGADDGCRALIDEVRDACRAADVEFAVVAGDELVAAIGIDEDLYPVARSVPEALRYFADVSGARQQVLLPLLGRTA